MLISPLDYETEENHTLIIRASDSGEHARYADFTLYVQVDDVNDNAPEFKDNTTIVEVPETLSIGEENGGSCLGLERKQRHFDNINVIKKNTYLCTASFCNPFYLLRPDFFFGGGKGGGGGWWRGGEGRVGITS